MQGANDGSVVDDVVSCGANGDNILGAAPERCHGDVRLPRILECGSVGADLGFSEAAVFGAQMSEDLEERMAGDAGGAVDLCCGGVVEIGWSAGIGGGNEGLASCDGVGDSSQY